MKQIIEGKVYNTETAEELAGANAGLSTSDFGHWREALYRTKKGAYFIAGGGGPRTRWAVAARGGGTGGSAGIKAVSTDEAREWVEKYANDEYETIFGAAPEA